MSQNAEHLKLKICLINKLEIILGLFVLPFVLPVMTSEDHF